MRPGTEIVQRRAGFFGKGLADRQAVLIMIANDEAET